MGEFDAVCDERRLTLHLPFWFTTLIDRIRSEASNVRYVKEKGTHEAKGSWRPVFRFDVGAETFDMFFNSPYGYRGWYLADPSEGRRRNEVLISALAERLVNSIRGSAELLNQLRLSLGSTSREDMD